MNDSSRWLKVIHEHFVLPDEVCRDLPDYLDEITVGTIERLIVRSAVQQMAVEGGIRLYAVIDGVEHYRISEEVESIGFFVKAGELYTSIVRLDDAFAGEA